MKIPKYIDKLINQRQKIAEQLMTADCQLCDWMEEKGMDLSELSDCVATGCMMYCEPENAARIVRNAIIEYEER
jgi:hypothetical protein